LIRATPYLPGQDPGHGGDHRQQIGGQGQVQPVKQDARLVRPSTEAPDLDWRVAGSPGWWKNGRDLMEVHRSRVRRFR
jgi:hypothetical protein